jgi:GTP-binding nuclear protein Ran
MTSRSYKIVLVGDGATGKSTYVQRLVDGTYRKAYTPTLGVEVSRLRLNVEHGDKVERVRLNFWDTAGQERFGGLGDGYYTKADAALVFVDPENPQNASSWTKSIQRVCGEHLPIALVISKSDTKEVHRALPKVYKNFALQESVHLISSRNSGFMGDPLEDLLSAMFGEECTILEGDPTLPPETILEVNTLPLEED